MKIGIISWLNRRVLLPIGSVFLDKRIAVPIIPVEPNRAYPLLSELYNCDQLDRHGEQMARRHQLERRRGRDMLLPRLTKNEQVLIQTNEELTRGELAQHSISPAGTWLIDNFYLIEEQIGLARQHFPRAYSMELPQLRAFHSNGFPRVYAIISDLISHVDGRIDEENLRIIINSYQRVTTLKLGELWAVPIMLRLALIENLQSIATRIAVDRRDRAKADYWADRILHTAENNPGNTILELADMARADIPLSCSFVAQLTQKIQNQNSTATFALTWIEQRLMEQGLTLERQIALDSQQQAINHVSIRNSITSLRIMTSVNWKQFVEAMSRVEGILRNDPACVYQNMDFATRDMYRHVIEKIAKKGNIPEHDVAAKAIALAHENAVGSRTSHVGYYLIDRGLKFLERSYRMNRSVWEIPGRVGMKAPLPFYLSSIAVLTALFSIVAIRQFGHSDLRIFRLFGFLVCMGFSQAAIALVNWLVTVVVSPKILPKMDYSQGVPPEASTLITVPAMLSSEGEIEELINKLEVSYHSNHGENIFFSILSDFTDAKTETTPDDEKFMALTISGIRSLNDRYESSGCRPFLFFHRQRKWNKAEKCWMGYERKRGKLEALNSFLTGTTDAGILVEGDRSHVSNIRYVITLDTDTDMPRESVRHLIETMAHLLNRPVYDSARKRVVEGYSILQPRVVSSLPAEKTSWYAYIFGCDSGIDPYTQAVSDIYQDLFHEGSYIGKGIYDVASFTMAIADRLPENRILSHDLLEGAYARSGLVSGILLVDEFPGQYRDERKRRHRWVRGDWQIACWMGLRVPGYKRKSVPNPVSFLSKWKIFDNLRRSLTAIVYLTLIMTGWLCFTSSWSGVFLVSVMLLIPLVPGFIHKAFLCPARFPLGLHVRMVAGFIGIQICRLLFAVVTLPYEAMDNLGAILSTFWRVNISRRHLLEWVTHKRGSIKNSNNLLSYFRMMGIAPVLSIIMAGVLYYAGRLKFEPLLVLWTLSPVVAWFVSRPVAVRPSRLSLKQFDYLGALARKTWRYFETFAGPDDNWLPADNYQEEPLEAVAHRTSPTNIGLSLLSNLGAYDLGYLCMGQLIDRTRKSFKSMELLTRFHGHFLNWYDTGTLQPLDPQYISTVDSGNLAGYLLTLRSGLMDIRNQPVFRLSFYRGLRHTVCALREHLDYTGNVPKVRLNADTGLVKRIGVFEDTLRGLESKAQGLKATYDTIHTLLTDIRTIRDLTRQDITPGISWWLEAIENQCVSQTEDLQFLMPWLEIGLPDAAGKQVVEKLANTDSIVTLEQYSFMLQNSISSPMFHDGKPDQSDSIEKHLRQAAHRVRTRMELLDMLAEQCRHFAEQDYAFLYDQSRKLLSIGYDVTNRRCDQNYYDLLASEARLCSFIGIARGQLPVEHWFALGRLITIHKGKTILLSWGGSMFEYLMPQLIMPGFDDTLLGQTCKAIVDWQIEYGRERGVPWGISESGENSTDANLNYQYRSFGVPGLGFKRGLAADLVISPYATMLALMVKPEEACRNLQRMSVDGYEGRYGLFEAIDFTPTRSAYDHGPAVIRSFMSHHLGMSFISTVNLFMNNIMVRRFESDPLIQATTLLLREKVPATAPVDFKPSALLRVPDSFLENDLLRVFTSVQTAVPEVHLLSNGRYHVMLTNAGGGYSRWNDMSVTRWNEDVTRDNYGSFFYVKDVTNGKYWSTAFQPTCCQPVKYEAIFSQARAEFRRRDEGIETYTEIAVSSEDDIENRRITLRDFSGTIRTLELTSYSETVLTSPAADSAHTAFSNLFVQTEILPGYHAILSTRRPRSPEENAPWMFHLLVAKPFSTDEISHETDRLSFIGRSLTGKNPAAMEMTGPLGNSEGSVLDPVAAIRCRVSIPAWSSVTVGFITGMANSRQEAIALIEKYQDHQLADRVFDMAVIRGKMALQQLNITEADAQLYGRLAGSILFGSKYRRASSTVIHKNVRGQSNLWAYGISGDLPIVLLRIADPSRIALAAKLLKAHAYWRLKGLSVDLVIWNEETSGYRQMFRDEILAIIAASPEALLFDRKGGIFLPHPDQMPEDDRILMQAAARIVLFDTGGTLSEQIQRAPVSDAAIPRIIALRGGDRELPLTESFPQTNLLFFNGWGGFTQDGREYIIQIKHKKPTPMPWVNVVANKRFGTVISAGGGYTWFENAHEYRVTPWYNDPVSDQSGEAFYIRDEKTGDFWSAAPGPAPGVADYLNRQGFGYSVFEYKQDFLKSELWIYVDTESPVKFWMLKLRNDSNTTRQLSVTGFLELVLGESRQKNQMHIRTGIDSKTGAILASNPYNTEFAGRVVFFQSNEARRSVSGDRTEFLGRNGSMSDPAALHRVKLSGSVGVGLDPAAILQIYVDLEPGQEKDIVFFLGAGHDLEEARELISRFQGSQAAYAARDRVWNYWSHTLGAINIETPDKALNMIANGWLVYQTMAARLWGRSGYYQSGGAFGFRDQLQDVMALIHTEPRLVREHLLLCASHQFSEGDVQHWWHPPAGRGVRTNISDDYLWLPFVTSDYVSRIGDKGVLDESVCFLQSRLLEQGEDSLYDLPSVMHEKATLYEHCKRAILHALRFGRHGLPLMGGGDWNDGMNLVGAKGRGESVWLGFFLYDVLRRFGVLAKMRGDEAFYDLCKEQAKQLRQKIESEAWDGEWYLRAFCDDGGTIGSSQNEECKIDSIAQSWSVLSAAGSPERTKKALHSLERELVDRDKGLIRLLHPPFDKASIEPGYIKGYVPGIRENGGQYTHAAIWAVMAFAKLGDARKVDNLVSMINPVNHGSTEEKIVRYLVEPYVMAADIYGSQAHSGRGGWTWYTGSASLMYRLIIESVLGLQLKVDTLSFKPCVSAEWKYYKIHYRYRETVYHCVFNHNKPGATISVILDGVRQETASVPLVDDRRDHNVEIVIE